MYLASFEGLAANNLPLTARCDGVRASSSVVVNEVLYAWLCDEVGHVLQLPVH